MHQLLGNPEQPGRHVSEHWPGIPFSLVDRVGGWSRQYRARRGLSDLDQQRVGPVRWRQYLQDYVHAADAPPQPITMRLPQRVMARLGNLPTDGQRPNQWQPARLLVDSRLRDGS